jgi:hypothetical protein
MKLVRWISFAIAMAIASPATAAEVSESDAKAWVALFDKIVDAVVANRADCKTMADDLDAIITVNQATIRVVRDAKSQGKKLPPSAMQKITEGAKRMMGSLDKCGRDEGVAAAFSRIDLGGRR